MQSHIFGMSSDSEVEDFVPKSSRGRQIRVNRGDDLSTTSGSMKQGKQKQQVQCMASPFQPFTFLIPLCLYCSIIASNL